MLKLREDIVAPLRAHLEKRHIAHSGLRHEVTLLGEALGVCLDGLRRQ